MRKYKITVLSNLDNNSGYALKSAIGLAKIIDGEIEVFSVNKASDIIKGDNQLSAMRSINYGHNAYRKKMKDLIEPTSKQYDIPINYSYSIGNVKAEIEQFIDTKKPDIIVLGKRRDKLLNLDGDRITSFVLNKFKGVILIANANNVIEPGKEIALGMLNNLGAEFNLDFAEDLMVHAQQPLKSFKIAQKSARAELQKESFNGKTLEYVFEQSDTALKGISNYLTKNNIDVLYIDRFSQKYTERKNSLKSDIHDIINKVNVTLLVTGEESYNL